MAQTNITEVDEFTTPITAPENGDLADVASLLAGRQGIVNRTKHLERTLVVEVQSVVAVGAFALAKPSWVRANTPVTVQWIPAGGSGGNGSAVPTSISRGGGGGGSAF